MHVSSPFCWIPAKWTTYPLHNKADNNDPFSWRRLSFFSRNPWGEIPSLGSPNMFSKNNVSKTSSSQTVVIILSTQTMHNFFREIPQNNHRFATPPKKGSRLMIPVKTGFRFHLADSRVGLLGRKSVDTRHDSTLTTRKGWDEENTRNSGKKWRCFLFFWGDLLWVLVYMYNMYNHILFVTVAFENERTYHSASTLKCVCFPVLSETPHIH